MLDLKICTSINSLINTAKYTIKEKMKPNDVQPETYIKYGVEHKRNDPKFYVVSDFNGEEVVETLYEKDLQNTSQRAFRTYNQ